MLHQTIRTMRKARGFSQQELAARLHVVRQTVSKWETGHSVPDADMLVKLAKALDTTTEVLLGGQPPASQDPVGELAARLDRLNAQLARRMEQKRKIRRAIFAGIGLLALVGILREILGAVQRWQFARMLAETPSILGGADEATSIFVSCISWQDVSLLLVVAAAIVAVLGVYFTRPK